MSIEAVDESTNKLRDATGPGRSGRSVFIVDPSCYSLPYDYSLCEALTGQGCKVALERSRFLHGDVQFPCTFSVREEFYRVTHRFAALRGTVWKYLKGTEHAASTRGLLQRVQQERPDIVHYQWLMAPAVEGYFLERLSRIAPVVLTVHNTNFFHNIPSSRLQAVGFRSAVGRLDAVIVHTAYSKRRVVEEGWMDADKVHIIPHGVLDHYSSRDHSPVPESAGNTILFFGAIAPYKGLDVLLKAFASMPPETRAKTRIVVAGRADMNIAPIRELADQLGIAGRIDWNIRFINDCEIPNFFRKATVVALPYREIDQSGVLLTAIAFDKPIVATRVGGIPETIEHGTHGLLVQPDNVRELAHALHSVLVNAEWRRSMQHAVHVLGTGELSWRNVARKTIDLYEQLLQERRSKQRTFPQARKDSRTIR